MRLRAQTLPLDVDHDGNLEQVENPRYLKQSKALLASLQRDLALVKK